MKTPADSLVLACANLLLFGLCWVADRMRVRCCELAGETIVLIVVPTLVLVSLFFLVRDLTRASTRLYALLAVPLLIITAVLIYKLEAP
jgi:hypothetical protein